MSEPKKLLINWSELPLACADICYQIEKTPTTIDYIVGVVRGGTVPAVCISHILNIPMLAVEYSSKSGKGDNKNHVNEVRQIPPLEIPSGTGQLPTPPSILLVDDIVDSGNTLSELVSIYQQRGHTVFTASLFYKHSAVIQPTFAWREVPPTDPWIVFPWEI